MKQHTNVDFEIDAVIAWVDGNDEAHLNKMTHYVEDKSKLGNQQFRTRFDQVNEIEFSVKSILKYAPFVRNIFIVTDGQTPLFFALYFGPHQNIARILLQAGANPNAANEPQ